VAFSGTRLDSTGMLIDFTDIKKHLDKTVAYLDHKFLNEITPFDEVNPTAENLAAFVLEQLRHMDAENAKICEVEIWESESSSVILSIS
jgi:6-pyruvoyltetrahydropterin/6-carboxytetrahydropterin synthase